MRLRGRVLFWLTGSLTFLLLGFAARLAFHFLNGPPDLPEQDLGRTYFLGLRFDLTVAAYVFVIPWLLWIPAALLPDTSRIRDLERRALVGWTSLWCALFIFLSFVDAGYYGFYQDRLNVILFGFLEDDTWAVTKSIWKNYPVVWIFLTLALLLWLQTLFWRRLGTRWFSTPVSSREDFGRKSAVAAVSLVFFLLNAVAARGSLGLFPLGDVDTHVSSHPFLNLLSTNSAHAFGRAVQNKSASRSQWNSNLKAFGYEQNPRQAWADYFEIPLEQVPTDPRDLLRRRSPANPVTRESRPHVLVLVMESFGADWLRYDQEPFDLVGPLKRHFQRDILWTNFISGSGATIGSLSALMAGVPHRPHSDFLTEGPDLATPVRTAPARVFRRAGYEARFIYAGNPGWRDISKYAYTQSFQAVDGDTEIEKELGRRLPRHDWGIFDEDLWDYVEKRLEGATAPQFHLVMTTANHPPYQLSGRFPPPALQVPAELDARLIGDKSVAHLRFQTFRDSNERLSEFLDRLKNRWGDRLVVAMTGDHGFWIVHFDETRQMQRFSVPFYLHLPPALVKKAERDRFGQHTDIWPTLYNAVFDGVEYDSLSNDMLDPSAFESAQNFGRLALSRDGGVFIGASPDADRAFDWAPGFAALQAGKMTESLRRQARKYRSLNALLDDFFRLEKEP